MSFADQRAEFLRNRVLTATPAQRIVMLYDRMALDVNLARSAGDSFVFGQHLSHAMSIVAELQSSLDHTAGGPADNLARLYMYVLQQLIVARGGDMAALDNVDNVMVPLRETWAAVAETVAAETPVATVTPIGSRFAAVAAGSTSSSAWLG